jgi:hypothetical protein
MDVTRRRRCGDRAWRPSRVQSIARTSCGLCAPSLADSRKTAAISSASSISLGSPSRATTWSPTASNMASRVGKYRYSVRSEMPAPAATCGIAMSSGSS